MPKAIQKNKSPKALNSDLLAGADYEIDTEKGLRRVKPYYFEFKTSVTFIQSVVHSNISAGRKVVG